MLKSKVDGSFYIGYTRDLRRRFKEHNDGENISTKHKKPFELIYYEAYKSDRDAKYRESNLKKHAQALKAL
ncbi:MAG TPA: GIY-YIG nuclease family protein, partial [Candidatus Paceibacterota bacterium]|nr:GIY-YIG nuclease family protein [Candidatus Paceibacterota bacterium]